MTLPSSPPITLAQVRAEFGASSGTPLHDFVRGGAYVPDISSNSGVPTSPPIRLAQLCGATDYVPMSLTQSSADGVCLVGPARPPTCTASGSATVSVSGGQAPYSYSWVQTDTHQADLRDIHTDTVSVSETAGSGITTLVHLKCTVKDATGATKTINATVKLEHS